MNKLKHIVIVLFAGCATVPKAEVCAPICKATGEHIKTVSRQDDTCFCWTRAKVPIVKQISGYDRTEENRQARNEAGWQEIMESLDQDEE